MPTQRAIANLNWQDYGGDGPPMLLIHGLGGSIANWNAVGPRLAKGLRVIAIDLPGFGLSPPGPDYAISTHADAVISFIEELGEPVVLMGNSMGGLVAERVASTRNDLVTNLILVAPATPVRLTDPELNWLSAIRLAIESIPVVGEVFLRALAERYTTEELVDLSLRMISHQYRRVPPDVVQSLVDSARARKSLPWAGVALNRTAASIAWSYRRPRDFVAMIRRITAPTLLIQGADDPIVSPGAVDWLASLRSDWQLIRMEDTGHIPQLDSPVRFTKEVLGWLDPDIT